MDAIEVLMQEHALIQRMNGVVRAICLRVLDGVEVPVEDLRQGIDFIRHYADRHHHGKEEQLLFHEMQTRLGTAAESLVRHGMLVEHDMARLYVSEWEAALDEYARTRSPQSRLDILTYASGYTKLLARHIEKEDAVVYTFARRQLPAEVLAGLNAQTEAFEQKAAAQQVQQTYLALVEALEKRY